MKSVMVAMRCFYMQKYKYNGDCRERKKKIFKKSI